MNIFKSLSNFLYDKDYFIALYENEIYIYNYYDITFLGNTKVIIKFAKFTLTIIGKDLFVKQLDKKEMLIAGTINGVNKDYE